MHCRSQATPIAQSEKNQKAGQIDIAVALMDFQRTGANRNHLPVR
jgi:hypothetical protein